MTKDVGWVPLGVDTERLLARLLAEYFDINLRVIEEEKRQMLAELRRDE